MLLSLLSGVLFYCGTPERSRRFCGIGEQMSDEFQRIKTYCQFEKNPCVENAVTLSVIHRLPFVMCGRGMMSSCRTVGIKKYMKRFLGLNKQVNSTNEVTSLESNNNCWKTSDESLFCVCSFNVKLTESTWLPCTTWVVDPNFSIHFHPLFQCQESPIPTLFPLRNAISTRTCCTAQYTHCIGRCTLF